MNKHLLYCVAFLLLSVRAAGQDSFTVRAQRYIAQYNNLAVAEQRRAGVPASVTLAQGVLETEAGKSELVCMANNHFGIKCKSDYGGDKFFHDDDAPKECFKMYKCAEDSYRDHSDYLKRNARYSQLFNLSQTDYAAWAIGLKRCGYATNPQYAQRLIKIIEDFKLQEYTYYALDSTSTKVYTDAFAEDGSQRGTIGEPTKEQPKVTGSIKPVTGSFPVDTFKLPDTTVLAKAAPVTPVKPALAVAAPEVKKIEDTTQRLALNAATVVVPQAAPHPSAPDTPAKATVAATNSGDTQYDSGKIVVVRGLKAFHVHKGELLLQYAVKYNIRYNHLLEMNDMPDGPAPADMMVYLERKLTSGTHQKHVVKDGETLYLVAQDEGMDLKRLMALNMLDEGEEPAIGTTLELQSGASHKPSLRALPEPDLKTSPNLSYIKPTPKDEYVEIKHTKPVDTVHQAVKQEIARDAFVSTIHVPADTAKPKTEVAAAVETAATPPATTIAAVLKKQDTVITLPVTAAVVKTEAPVAKPIDTAATVAKATPAPKKDTVVKDELEDLKKQLDKVVYADDAKLLPPPVKGKIDEPIKLTTNFGDAAPAPKKGKETKAAKKPQESKGSKYYTVKKGDTLGAIAKKNNVTIKQLEKLNDVDATDLQLGQKLRIK